MRWLVRFVKLCLYGLGFTFFWSMGKVGYQAFQVNQPTAEAALVLGAAAWGGHPSPVLEERTRYAVELYRNKKVQWIICTGGTINPKFPTEAAVACSYAAKQGVPRSSLLIEPNSRNSTDNLRFAKLLAESEQIHSYAIVSDPFHMARALLIAHSLGMDARPASTPYTRYKKWNSQLGFWLRESLLYTAILLKSAISQLIKISNFDTTIAFK